jgi:Tfp pilus assembly protein PilP
MTRVVWVAAALAACAGAVSAQTPVGDRPNGTTASGYNAGGRRDPFVSLIAIKKEPTPASTSEQAPRVAGAGLAGLAVTDVVVKGILRSGPVLLAILEGPGGKTYIARRQDRLQDGTVKSIEADAVVFAEQVADAHGATRARDVRKSLHPMIGGGR